MFHFDYLTEDVCARLISFDLDEEKVRNISFMGGCDGNLKVISKLLEGQSAGEFVDKLEGTTCGRKSTSCGDQLAKAVREALVAKNDPNYVSPLAEED